MKNRMRRISNAAAWLILSVLFSGTCFSDRIQAQNFAPKKSSSPPKAEPIAEMSDVWYADYTITIGGNGVIEPESPGEAKTYWKVDRTYSGTVELSGGKLFGIGSGKEADEAMKTKRFVRFIANSPKMNVKIDDYIILIKEEEICDENVKTLDKTTLEADVKGETSTYLDTSLTIDNQMRSHNVSIPILLIAIDGGKGALLKFRRTLETNKTTKFGTSTQSNKTLSERYDYVFDYPVPRIFGLLENKRIRHKDYVPLTAAGGGYEFTSKKEIVTDRLLPNIDTEDKVKIQVFYRLKKFKN